MNIKTQQYLGAWTSVAIVLMIGMTLFVASQRVNQATGRSDLASEIVIGISELRFVMFEYILHHHERPRAQWQLRHEAVSKLLAGDAFEGTAQQQTVNLLRQRHQDLKDTFSQLTRHYASGGNGSSGPAETALSRELEARLTSQLLASSQEMITATFRLVRASESAVANTQRWVGMLAILAIIVMGFIVVANTVLSNRYILKPIGRLQRGIEIIGNGDLSYRTGITSSDEIGVLSRAFDSMTARVLESRAALEAERLRAAKREAIMESEVRYRRIVDSVAEGIISIDDRLRIVMFNPAAEQMFGRSSEEMNGQPLSALIPERFRGQHDEHIRRFAATGQTHRSMGQYGLIHGLRASGAEFPVEAAISQSGQSPQKLLTVILRDITERLRVEAERKRLLDVLEASLNEIYIFSPETLRFWYVNQSALRNLGYSADAVHAMTPLDLKAEFTVASFRELVAPLLRGAHEVIVFQTTHRRADGTFYPVEVHLQLVGQETQRVFLAVIFDITRRRQAEQALHDYAEQLRQLSRRMFETEETERRRLARELHDRVGQNVTALSLNLDMVRSELPADVLQKMSPRLNDCEGLLYYTAQLVRDIQVDLRPPGLDVLGLVVALSEHARQVAGRSSFKVTVIGTELVPRLPPATEITVFRIVQEALNNISKHAQATEVTIALEASPVAVALSIADNGRGFDPAVLPAQPTRSLGMVSMRERAESIGGRLRVESVPGQGTRVIVEAPRANHNSSGQPHLPGIESVQDLGTWSTSKNNRKDEE